MGCWVHFCVPFLKAMGRSRSQLGWSSQEAIPLDLEIGKFKVLSLPILGVGYWICFSTCKGQTLLKYCFSDFNKGVPG